MPPDELAELASSSIQSRLSSAGSGLSKTKRSGIEGCSQSVLRHYGRRDGVRGALEGDEKPVPCRVDLVAIPRLECLTQQSPVLRQHIGVTVAQALEKACGVLDVAK